MGGSSPTKTATEALAEAIAQFKRREHDPEGLRQTAEDGYVTAQGSLQFQQKDDPDKDLISIYCEKCTKLIKKVTPSLAHEESRVCIDCVKATVSALQSVRWM